MGNSSPDPRVLLGWRRSLGLWCETSWGFVRDSSCSIFVVELYRMFRANVGIFQAAMFPLQYCPNPYLNRTRLVYTTVHASRSCLDQSSALVVGSLTAVGVMCPDLDRTTQNIRSCSIADPMLHSTGTGEYTKYASKYKTMKQPRILSALNAHFPQHKNSGT